MITPTDFLDKWNLDIFPLVEYDVDKINSLQLSEEDKEFLIEVGLPESAAPYMNFESSFKGGATKLSEKFYLNYYEDNFIYLGFTGAGDLICVFEKSGEVVSLNHENEKDKQFINSSVSKLAECLLVYSEFVKEIKIANGRRAFLERNATEESIGRITYKIKVIDEKALGDGCFWREELNSYNKP